MSTPNRGYVYPDENSAALVPDHLEQALGQIDADVQTLVDEAAAKVGLNPDGTAPAALEAQIEQIAQANGTPPGAIPIFATLAEAEAWMSANPGRTALTTEAPADPGAWVATPPSFSTRDRTYTIPTDAGATYQVDGITVGAGTYDVGEAARTVTVDAVAQIGYTLAPPTSWTYSWPIAPPETYEEAVVADGPVHFLPLDDGAGSTTARNLGTAATGWASTAVTYEDTALLGALTRAGSFAQSGSTVQSPDALLLGGATAWTAEAMVRLASVPVGRWGVIGSSRDTWALKGNNSTIFAYQGGTFTPTGVTLAAEVAYHLAATYDGATLTLYVNGASVGSSAVTGGVPTPATVPAIGHTGADGGSDGLPGLIAGVAVYTKALSAARILAHAQSAGVAA